MTCISGNYIKGPIKMEHINVSYLLFTDLTFVLGTQSYNVAILHLVMV